MPHYCRCGAYLISTQVIVTTVNVQGHIFLQKLVVYVSAEGVIVDIADPRFRKGPDLIREPKSG